MPRPAHRVLRVQDLSFTFNGGYETLIDNNADAAGITLAAGFATTLLDGDLILAGPRPYGAIVNDADMSITGALYVSPQYGASTETVLENAGTISQGADGALVIDPSYAQMINTGKVSINGGTLKASATDLVNHSTLSLTNGTLILDCLLLVNDLTRFLHTGCVLQIDGNLDLAGNGLAYGSPAL